MLKLASQSQVRLFAGNVRSLLRWNRFRDLNNLNILSSETVKATCGTFLTIKKAVLAPLREGRLLYVRSSLFGINMERQLERGVELLSRYSERLGVLHRGLFGDERRLAGQNEACLLNSYMAMVQNQWYHFGGLVHHPF